MKNKLMRLMGVLAIIFLSLGFVGCSIGMDSLEDIINKNNLTAQITYYSNGGWFNNDASSKSRDIYYKENSKALEITDQTSTKIKHEEYIYAGWYTIKTVQIEGIDYFVVNETAETKDNFVINSQSVVLENNEQFVIKIQDYQKLVLTETVPLLQLDQAFDFSNTRLNKGDRLYLAVKWVPNQKVEYVLFAEDCESITVKNSDGSTSTVKHGEVLATRTFETDGTFKVPTDYYLVPASCADATFVDYYVYSEDATNAELVRLIDVMQSVDRPADGTNYKIFVKYVAGSWNVVRAPEDVSDMFNKPSAKKFYLSRNIDCSANGEMNLNNGTFSGTIRGNGYTISGITLKTANLTNGSSISLFGEMVGSAIIKDISFTNLTVKVFTRKFTNSFIKVNLIANAISGEGSLPTIENVSIDNVSIAVDLKEGVSIENIYLVSGNYKVDSWLCKDYLNSVFLSEFSTLTIGSYQISINNDVIASGDSLA